MQRSPSGALVLWPTPAPKFPSSEQSMLLLLQTTQLPGRKEHSATSSKTKSLFSSLKRRVSGCSVSFQRTEGAPVGRNYRKADSIHSKEEFLTIRIILPTIGPGPQEVGTTRHLSVQAETGHPCPRKPGKEPRPYLPAG